jgi:hypothetical protein
MSRNADAVSPLFVGSAAPLSNPKNVSKASVKESKCVTYMTCPTAFAKPSEVLEAKPIVGYPSGSKSGVRSHINKFAIATVM